MSLITDTNIVRPTRRSFLRHALGAGAGAALLPSVLNRSAKAATVTTEAAPADIKVLNFALHLEYLEAQYYTLATTGLTLEASGIMTDGTGTHGTVIVKDNPKVTFNTTVYGQAAAEIAQDEQNHVKFLRAALGASTAAMPTVDLLNSFNALAQAAGLGDTFDPFGSEINFLLGAFIFEDVGVTAYRGGSTKIVSKAYLKAAAGILAVEALHAGEIRSFLLAAGMQDECAAISNARDSLDGGSDLDQSITDANNNANIAPTDANGLVFSRNTRKVLDIVFGATGASKGGFFPDGVNL